LQSAALWLTAADGLLQHLDTVTRRHLHRSHPKAEARVSAARDFFGAVVRTFEAQGSGVADSAVSLTSFRHALTAIAVAWAGRHSVLHVSIDDAHRCCVAFLSAQGAMSAAAGATAHATQRPTPNTLSANAGRLKALAPHFAAASSTECDILAQARMGSRNIPGNQGSDVDDALMALFVGYADSPSSSTAKGFAASSPDVQFAPKNMLKVLKDASLATEFVTFADVQRAVAAVQLATFRQQLDNENVPAHRCSSAKSPWAESLSLAEFRCVLGLLARSVAVSHCRGDVLEASRLFLRKLAVTEPGILRSRIHARARGGPLR
jgi:hypothetical protein